MIVIPMAGLSRRFTQVGYETPKYMLPLRGRSLFSWALASFEAYFNRLRFLFIGRDVADTEAFIARECLSLGLADARTVMLDTPTAGQAKTVEIGLNQTEVGDETAVTIFNIDTFRPGFRFPKEAWMAHSAGYLEVFHGGGANCSFVRPAAGPEPLALETAEKRPISDLSCSGLYHFTRAGDFRRALGVEQEHQSMGELYVAPIYNHLIAAGLPVHYHVVPKEVVVFCGVPSEYEALLAEER